MIPTRETFGNIPPASVVAFYGLAVVSMVVFGVGVWRRFRLWRQGVPVSTGQLVAGGFSQLSNKWKSALCRVLKEGVGQARVRGRGMVSCAHITLFLGFMMLLLGTTLLEVDHLASGISAGLKFHQGLFYVGYEFTMDVFGVLFLGGCLFFLGRRIRRPSSVGHRATDWYVLMSFLAIGVTGYLVEGLRLVWQHPMGIGASASPIGLLVAGWFGSMTVAGARSAHLWIWWFHSLLVFGFIASLPFTRLIHAIVGPLNLLLAQPTLGKMVPVTVEDVERTERIGVASIPHFNRQQLLSLDACMECGRCEEACPAFATGKPLSPKALVQALKGAMSTSPGAVPAGGNGACPVPGLHEGVIAADTLWSCTACSACVRVCPVRVDPLTLLTDMRRNRVGESELSGTAATALRRMQSSGNPWGLPAADRANWAEGLDIPLAKDHPDFDVLYWVGCAGSYDRRAQRVARAFAKLLKEAGVNFAILGREEKCTGDSARRLGDEFLFQELAQENMATFARYKVRKIVTHCPHCLNSLVADYPQFGGNYEVVHHTQFLQQLIAGGRLKLEDGKGLAEPTTYHDPCYLARVNGIHQAPRELLMGVAAGSGSHLNGLREMARRRETTFCCGAGGGRMWMEEEAGQRVCSLRAKEALATGAKTVAVGCPFCLTMMTDGVATQSDSVQVKDVAEILADRLNL